MTTSGRIVMVNTAVIERVGPNVITSVESNVWTLHLSPFELQGKFEYP